MVAASCKMRWSGPVRTLHAFWQAVLIAILDQRAYQWEKR